MTLKTKPLLSCIFLFVVLFFTSHSLSAQRKTFGVGVILGEPTGLSVKNWMSTNSAWDAAAAWSFSGDGYFHLHFDFLQHFNIITVGSGELPLYVGIGARAQFRDEFNLGIRVPIGAEYLLADIPIGIFAEVVPILDLIPNTDFDFEFGAGGRFYF